MTAHVLLVHRDGSSIEHVRKPLGSLNSDAGCSNHFVEYTQPIDKLSVLHKDIQTGQENTNTNGLHLANELIRLKDPIEHALWCSFVCADQSKTSQSFPFSLSTFSTIDHHSNQRCPNVRKYMALVSRNILFLFSEFDDHQIKLKFSPNICKNFELVASDREPLLTGLLMVCSQSSSMSRRRSFEENPRSSLHRIFYLTHPLELIRSVLLLADNGDSICELPQSLEFCQSFKDIVVMFDTNELIVRFFQLQYLKKSSDISCSLTGMDCRRDQTHWKATPNLKSSKFPRELISSTTRSPLLCHNLKSMLASPSPKNLSRSKHLISNYYMQKLPMETPIQPSPQELVLKPISWFLDDTSSAYSSLHCDERPRVNFSDENARSILVFLREDPVHVKLNV